VFSTETPIRDRHAHLRATYTRHPEQALIVKRVRTNAAVGDEPSHCIVVPENLAHPDAPYGVAWPLGLDLAVGGLQDAPNPGEMLCAALASCQHGLLRMIAANFGIELDELEVEVTGTVDVRGTLAIDPQVRVGFESMRMNVRLRAAEGTPDRLLERFRLAGEYLCVTLDTLRRGVPVEATYELTAVAQPGAEVLAPSTRSD
jgi:uncharacterized OsmC-like protein